MGPERSTRRRFLLCIVLCLPLMMGQGGRPRRVYDHPIQGVGVVTQEPEHEGRRARCDLPKELHVKNIAGSDGLGQCGFASATHAGRFQAFPEFYGFLEWMKRQPGGAWPEKMDRMFEEFLGPESYRDFNYLHAFGDAAIPLMERAVNSGRMVLVTYGYSDRYGVSIDHMVNLVHLDDEWACILDNNFPGTWEWVPRSEFVQRFHWTTQGKSEGWCVIFIGHPQPPVPAR